MLTKQTGVSVIMPTYNQGAFIRRAITSLFTQVFQNWELILINDGGNDYTEQIVEDFVQDARINYYKNDRNKGLGYCLNFGIGLAQHENISYLPSDDIYHAKHLSSLYDTLSAADNAILCYSGVYYDNTDNYASGLSVKKTTGVIPQGCLQLVQLMHKRTNCKWIERDEFVTADLNTMFLDQLQQEGLFVTTETATCEWVNHPLQRHKIINKKYGGGISFYKKYYTVDKPVKLYTGDGHCVDEKEQALENKNVFVAQGKLKIVIVGELGFNPERLSAFEKDGHQLFGLWIDHPDIHNSVGPFPFGNIIELSLDKVQSQIEEIKPDIIYALLNTQAVKLAHYIMLTNPDIPFVWHFKEGPFFCRNAGIWKELVELYYNADGRIYINEESKNWYEQFIGDHERPSYILDGDLPPAKWFSNEQSELLSDKDHSIHTVMVGRPYGINPSDIAVLAKHNVHLHLYGEFYQAKWGSWVNAVNEQATGHLHLHAHCNPNNWVKELSQYDAGWLHCFESFNHGELLRCSWNDLNYPARISTLAVAGLPMIQKDNQGHIVASQRILDQLGIGVLFNSYEDLGKQLNDKKHVKEIRRNVWKNRMNFAFDYHIKGLLAFFSTVIRAKQNN